MESEIRGLDLEKELTCSVSYGPPTRFPGVDQNRGDGEGEKVS